MSYWDAVRNKSREAVTFLRQPPYHVALRPWAPLPETTSARAACTICRWHGRAFHGIAHCESAVCPRCRSIARDRFLAHCLRARQPWRQDLRVLETSPRLGAAYRRAMARKVDYLTSDYDNRAHRATMSLDLQNADLPDAALDVVVTSHVLEHVPDTDAALRELFRIVRPGGAVFLQVPVGQVETAPPPEPEWHDDHTPVFWRFGLDLTDRLRDTGFATTLLVTSDFARRVAERDTVWAEGVYPEFDAPALVEAAKPDDLTVVASDHVARVAGFLPSYMFLTWQARRP